MRPFNLKQGSFTGHADTEGEAVEAGSTMDVKVTSPSCEMTMVGPSGSTQDRPGEAQAQKTHLSTMGMTREDEIDIVFGQVMKSAWVMQHQQARMSLDTGVCGEKVAEVFFAPLAHVVGPHDLDGALSGRD